MVRSRGKAKMTHSTRACALFAPWNTKWGVCPQCAFRRALDREIERAQRSQTLNAHVLQAWLRFQ
jgi:hypothetical protein